MGTVNQLPEPQSLATYWRRREELSSLVTQHISNHYPNIVVRGSFERADFHLARNQDLSYSDVDLILPGISEAQRFPLAREISLELTRLGCELPVSVQPFNAFRELPERASRFLHLGEYLRRSAATPTDQRRLSYLRAKLAISLGKASDESFIADATAMRVKLGLEASYIPSQLAASCAVSCRGWPEEELFMDIALGRSKLDADARRTYLMHLRRLPGISPWLSDLMSRLILQAGA